MWQAIFNDWLRVGCDFLDWGDYTQQILTTMTFNPCQRWLLQKRWRVFNMETIGEYVSK